MLEGSSSPEVRRAPEEFIEQASDSEPRGRPSLGHSSCASRGGVTVDLIRRPGGQHAEPAGSRHRPGDRRLSDMDVRNQRYGPLSNSVLRDAL